MRCRVCLTENERQLHHTHHDTKVQARGTQPYRRGTQPYSKPIAGRTPCDCGYCDGLKVDAVDVQTGQHKPITAPSRTVVCPRCGGYNDDLRRRRVAHTADRVRRQNVHKSALNYITFTVERKTVKAANLASYSESYRFLTGDRGAWTRARKRLRYAASGDVHYTGIVASRPSDDLAHGHMLVESDLSAEALRDALHVEGLDVDVKKPQPTESADDFAACMAHYSFVNAVRAEVAGGSHRFVSSRGSGIGYNSNEARTARQTYAKKHSGQGAGQPQDRPPKRPHAPARGSIASNDETGNNSHSGSGSDSSHNGHSSPEKKVIEGGGTVCKDDREVRNALKRLLQPHFGEIVHSSRGEVVLCGLHAYPLVEVRTPDTTARWNLDWRDLAIIDGPRLLTHKPTKRSMSDRKSDTEKQSDRDAYNELHDRVEATEGAARYSRVAIDGEVTVKDHKTGEIFRRVEE